MREQYLSQKFTELNEKLKTVKENKSPLFSQAAVKEFFRGFDLPIIGSITFLKDKTKFFESIVCNVSSDQISHLIITDYEDYGNLLNELYQISPPCAIDFSFSLTKGIFPFLKDVTVSFSVFFSMENYEIDCEYADQQHLNFHKKYMEHISPDEIRSLRDRIAESILNKVSTQVDANI